MGLLEITQMEQLSREVVAQRLHTLADASARHNDVEFERGGLQFKVKVPAQPSEGRARGRGRRDRAHLVAIAC